MSKPVADTRVVSSNDGSGGASTRAADWSERCPVLVRGGSGVTAAETLEIGPVELPTELAWNNGDVVVEGWFVDDDSFIGGCTEHRKVFRSSTIRYLY